MIPVYGCRNNQQVLLRRSPVLSTSQLMERGLDEVLSLQEGAWLVSRYEEHCFACDNLCGKCHSCAGH
jgi:hypothetical protein